eukprot:4481421-Prymnesium_polylepis.2
MVETTSFGSIFGRHVRPIPRQGASAFMWLLCARQRTAHAHIVTIRRCSGDPADPLILFVHGASNGRGRDSRMWNGLVTSLAGEMAKAEEEAAQVGPLSLFATRLSSACL